MNNISLIGMPACGKSTVGVLLAKTLNMAFTDTDLLIQQACGKFLWQILEDDGNDGFNRKEEAVIGALRCENTCIATGGSAVYSEKAMNHLKSISRIIFLHVPVEEIIARTGDIKSRGVVIEKGKTLEELYDERLPLYKKYAGITVNAGGKSLEKVVYEISCLFL